MNHPIEFCDVYRHFGTQQVLRGLTFRVEAGKIYALLGRNGSGKTTALRILLGFLEPMAGRSFILGADSRALTPALRDRIGYVAEGHRLYKTMPVRDAIRFEAGTRPRFDRAYAEKAVGRCGLPRNKLIGLLSRGQRAQLALIIAAAGAPEVLICDDPAMGLDVVMRREFLDVLIDLLSDRGCAVLFSSHILTDVERIADRAGILHEGRLIVDATLEDIKKRVEKRRWSSPGSGGAAPEGAEWILACRPVRQGFDLTLLDMTPEREATLRRNGATLTEAVALSLEDLFFELTRGPEARSPLSDREETAP